MCREQLYLAFCDGIWLDASECKGSGAIRSPH
jgi:hypothetical protein